MANTQPVKILIVNLHSSHNAGDDVLTNVTVALLRRHFPKAKIILAMNDPKSYTGYDATVGSFMTWVKSPERGWGKGATGLLALCISVFVGVIYRLTGRMLVGWLPTRQQSLLCAYFESHIVISSAGNFLYSGGRFGFALLMALGTIAFAWLVGKPIYTMPQTIGPIKRRWERWALRWVLRRIRLLFVRDPISRELLQTLKVWHKSCALVPDLAFLFPDSAPVKGEELLQAAASRLSQPRLGVTLINWQAQNRVFQQQQKYEKAVAAAIRTFVTETNGQAFLFAQVRGPSLVEDDRIPARRVHHLLTDLGDQVVQVDQEVTAGVLKAAYGLMDIFIGARLHSNIFALTVGTPAIMIQYQYKTRGVAQLLELEEWVIEIEQVTASQLSQKLKTLWASRAAVETQIETAVTGVIRQIEQVGARIAADFKTLS